MKHALLALLALGACATAPAHAIPPPGCPPQGYDRAALDALKANEWAIADERARNNFARSLVPCLADPDPVLRDGVAFEALQHLMRNGQLNNTTLEQINEELQIRLTSPDAQGFQQPFAALVLADVARTDRIAPWMSAAQRAGLLNAGIMYFISVRDYRGFDEGEGWRHGVAHGADLMLQLGLNPAFGRPELTRIRDALAMQLAPEGHAYVYGESERLVRPIIFMAQREVFNADEWREWLMTNTAVSSDAFSSRTGLARRHNMMAFLSVLHMQARLSENTADDALLPGAEAALRALP